MNKDKKKSNRIFFIIAVITLFCSFYFNFPIYFSDYGDPNFDSWSNGIMIADIIFNENFPTDSSFGKVITPGTDLHDGTHIESGDDLYRAYLNDKAFQPQDYSNYYSNIMAHRFIYHILNRVLPISNYATIELFYLINSFLMAICISMILLWIKSITNSVSVYITLGTLALFAPNFVMYGKNLYWAGWTLFLPMLSSILILKYNKFNAGRNAYIWPFFAAFISCLLKQVFYFEFVSTVMISMMVPYIYYCIEQKMDWKISYRRLIAPVVGGILSFFFASLIKFFMLIFDFKDFNQAIKIYFSPIIYRILGDTSAVNLGVKESANVSIFATLKIMLLKPAINIKGNLLITDLILIAVLILVTIAAGYIIFTRKQEDTHMNACLTATWISLLAPFSWFVLAKPHTYVHNHHCSVLWYVPFIPLAVSVISYFITEIYKKYVMHFPIKKGANKTISKRKIILVSIIIFVLAICFVNIYINRNVQNIQILNDVISNGERIYSDPQNGDIYYKDNTFYYIKDRGEDIHNRVFLHVIPENIEDLPKDIRQYEFQNLDFAWEDEEIKMPIWSQKRMTQRKISVMYPIKKIETGQFNIKTMVDLWRIEIDANKFLKLPATITPADLTDANWENGILRDGTTILLSGAKQEYVQLVGKQILLSNGEKNTISKVSFDDNWTHLVLKNPVGKNIGYPNQIEITK